MAKERWDVNCYEARDDGALILHLENTKGQNEEVIIPPIDVERMMYAGISALRKSPSRR